MGNKGDRQKQWMGSTLCTRKNRQILKNNPLSEPLRDQHYEKHKSVSEIEVFVENANISEN